jgi:hypothetical protein
VHRHKENIPFGKKVARGNKLFFILLCESGAEFQKIISLITLRKRAYTATAVSKLLLPERQAVFTATTCLESRKQYTSCAYLTIKAIGILLAKLTKKFLKYIL